MNAKPKPVAPATRVISYIRFSTAKQVHGTSIDRQHGMAQAWAAKHGYEFDESLRDEGRSAFKGKHVKDGALGRFLKKVEDGQIPAGSILFVEQLDRLSRATVRVALQQLLDIINAGLTIVTGVDEQVYSPESVDGNPMQLMLSLVYMIRANDESKSKSVRVSGALRSKCERWIKGEYRGLIGAPRDGSLDKNGKINPGTDPAWVLYDREQKRFVFDPQNEPMLRRLISLRLAGNGPQKIARALKAEGLPLSDSAAVAYVSNIIGSPALKGTKVLTVDGQEYALANYYPALLSGDEWDELQFMVNQKKFTRGKGTMAAILTGHGITYCGECRSPITTKLTQLKCCHYQQTGERCPGGKQSCLAAAVERALFAYCSDQMNLSQLLAGGDQVQPIKEKIADKRAALIKTESKIKSIKAAMLASDDEPETFIEAVRELEVKRSAERKSIEKLEQELSTHARAQPSTADAWATLIDGVAALDHDSRMKARKLVINTFERIDLFMQPVQVSSKQKAMTMQVTSKSGVIRSIDFTLRSGELIARDEVNIADEAKAEPISRKPKPRSKAVA